MTDRVDVVGTGSVSEKPDVLAAALAAEAQSSSVATALAEANAAFGAMTAAARAGGVDDLDIRSTGLSVQPSHDHHGRPDGYVARMPLSLTLRDLATAGDVLAAVVEAGGDHARVQGAALGTEDPGPALQQARELALDDARRQAEALAGQAGRALGRLLRVTTGDASGQPGAWPVSGGRQAALKSLYVEPGSDLVTVSVRVRFALD